MKMRLTVEFNVDGPNQHTEESYRDEIEKRVENAVRQDFNAQRFVESLPLTLGDPTVTIEFPES